MRTHRCEWKVNEGYLEKGFCYGVFQSRYALKGDKSFKAYMNHRSGLDL